MKPLPSLQNFIKARAVLSLESFQLDIYKLKKQEKRTMDFTYTYFIFKYKIGKTTYSVYSYKDCKHRKTTSKNRGENGYIKITKGYKSYKFSENELPPVVINSIHKHFDNCTKLLKENIKVVNTQTKVSKEKEEQEKQKIVKFIQNLDL